MQELYSIIEEGIRKGEIRDEDPSLLVSLLMSFIYSLRNLYKSDRIPLQSKYSLDHLIETINNVFIDGFIKDFTVDNANK